jgi:hypothetical protein
VRTSQKTALDKVIDESQKREMRYDVCPFNDCDQGQIMSRRHAFVAPCVHIAWQSSHDRDSSAEIGLDLGGSRPPHIEVSEYQSRWSNIGRPHDIPQGERPSFEEEFENAGSPDTVDGFLAQIRHQLQYMHQGREFRYSHDLMAHRLGRIQGRFEEQMHGIASEVIQRLARSQFLADCVSVLQGGGTWDD